MLLSAGGVFTCLTVKRLTKNIMATLFSFGIYGFLVVLSPWKMAPYTDTFGLLFPIVSIYCYLCYREAEKAWSKYVLVILALLFGMLGGFIKPSVYIIPIAIVGAEVLLLFADRRMLRYIPVEALVIIALYFGAGVYKEHIIEEIGLEFNADIEASWHHYFLMGLNGETTGGYNSGDLALFGEYQYESRQVRNAAELEKAAERLRERGTLGTLYFWLRKMVMIFNDGMFGWACEVWVDQYYPREMASWTKWTGRLRNLYWSEGTYWEANNTIGQYVWLLCIMGLPGICLKKEKKIVSVLVISFLGIFFYQMLFEARARYLFVFLPLIIAIASCGMHEYAYQLSEIIGKHRRKDGRSKEDAPEGVY